MTQILFNLVEVLGWLLFAAVTFGVLYIIALVTTANRKDK